MQINWQQCFQMNPHDKAHGIAATGDAYLISGYTPPSTGTYDVFLLKTDLEGNLLWDKTFGGASVDQGVDIFPTDDENYFISAISVSTGGDVTYNPYPGTVNYWILKIDSAGNKLWDKMYGGNGYDDLWAAITTSDGGIAAFGRTTSPDGDISIAYGAWDMWLLKTDSLGIKMWDFSIGAPGFDLGSAVMQTSDEGYLLGGSAQVEGGGNYECEPFSWYAAAILFKLDSNTNVEWQRCYSGSYHDGITALFATSDGYIVGGYTSSDDGDMDGCGYHLGYQNETRTDDIWLAKIDLSGNIVWQKCLGGSKGDYVYKIFETSDNGFLVFGHTFSNDGDVSGNHSFPGNPDIWVVKVSAEGELLWQQCIGSEGENRLEGAVIKTSDSTYVVASNTSSNLSGDLTCRIENGFVWLFEISDLTVGISEQPVAQNMVKVFPNPASTFVEFETSGFKSGTIRVIDITGRLRAEIPLNGERSFLDVRHLSAGMYLYQVTSGEYHQNGKIIISR